MQRLVFIELEKLIRSAVFWVAPIVLVFFLALMLFGFEVYAAKNGTPPSGANDKLVAIDNQFTGSVVVSAYSTVYKMIKNMINPFFPTDLASENDTDIIEGEEERVIPGKVDEFNYLGTFLKSLINPKPLPRPPCDCPCECSKDDKKSGSQDLTSFFLGIAYAAESPVFKVRPSTVPTDSFVERLKKRVVWLTKPEGLENMIIDRSRFNGLRFTYLSLYFAFVFVFPLITVVVVAEMFSGEFSRGTIRTCLLRSTKRSWFLFSKLLVLAIYLTALILFFVVLTLLVGVSFSGYGNLVMDSDLLGNEGVNRLILGDGAVMLFFISAPLAAIALFPLAALAVLLSYLKPEPATVIGITAIVYFILFTLGDLPLFEDINFLFFTTYMDAWTLIYEVPFPLDSLVYNNSIIALMTTGLLLLANYISTKKDIYV